MNSGKQIVRWSNSISFHTPWEGHLVAGSSPESAFYFFRHGSGASEGVPYIFIGWDDILAGLRRLAVVNDDNSEWIVVGNRLTVVDVRNDFQTIYWLIPIEELNE